MLRPSPARMLLLGAGFLLCAAVAPAAAAARNTFVCLPKPVKFDTCTSIRLLTPCQTDQDCDTRVCCKDWCGNYCAFKQRSFAVAKPPPVEPAPIDDDDEAEESTAPPPPPARGNRGRRADDESEEPPRRDHMRRRYKNRAGRRRRRMDAGGSDGAIMHGPGKDGDDREPSGNGLGGQLEHEYFDVRK